MVTIVKDIDRINEILQQHKDCNAQIWAYSISLRRMAVRLWTDIKGEQLMLVCGGVFYIQGFIERENANVSLSRRPDDMHEWAYTLTDDAAGFKLLAYNGIILARGDFSDFNLHFDSLFDFEKAIDE
ncbi:hypothetical protein [Chitinophaga pinensis]|uniref:Uncharacterized protein n=1 Tax=Chitinophaga pinensis (strain ATCC 43595 / DSM 2588 / LMG 13176 / NBRC 15968 / NCIMB 11800 / UQM 2034) TaxID=485918 RepID=A0A979GW96_CHIPD|nr:hypothetical protein [Chitinophaga pinensis]ACU61641.1 hypothetical protein Cpin_4184 [Chitinophaga pinensis DSM 2588]